VHCARWDQTQPQTQPRPRRSCSPARTQPCHSPHGSFAGACLTHSHFHAARIPCCSHPMLLASHAARRGLDAPRAACTRRAALRADAEARPLQVQRLHEDQHQSVDRPALEGLGRQGARPSAPHTQRHPPRTRLCICVHSSHFECDALCLSVTGARVERQARGRPGPHTRGVVDYGQLAHRGQGRR
jgi:hypothetical protein